MSSIQEPATAARGELRLPVGVRAQIEAWALAAYPDEACGLLVGRQRGARAEVVHARLARNLAEQRSRDRYDLDPLDQLAAENEARTLGLDVVGVWHSHPEHPARPSETDRSRAWPGWSYAIVSVIGRKAVDLRSWRLDGLAFREEEVTS